MALKTPYGDMTRREIEDSLIEDMEFNIESGWAVFYMQEEGEFEECGWLPTQRYTKQKQMVWDDIVLGEAFVEVA